MTLYAGIDLGTSGVKIVLADARDEILAEASEPLAVARPHPGWSEQHPDSWWKATCAAFDRLAADHPGLMARVAGIGLSGQMLGAVLVGADDRPTHECILWNDQRAIAECEKLLARVPDIGRRSSGNPDPGMTAPKLLWLARHHPRALDRAEVLMLPKDYLRLCLTGERASEPSDAAGTLLMDCRSLQWDEELATAAGWSTERLPRLVPSHAQAGRLRPELGARWGMSGAVPVAAGAGDNMACAVGVGAAAPGDGVVTIGTSGVLCAVDGRFHPAPEVAVLTNPHAAPGTWLSLGVVMSATQSLDWIAGICRMEVPELADAAEAMARRHGIANAPVMRPSLTGIRTPDNRPDAAAAMSGITATTDAAALAYAVMEGVAFQFLDCHKAQQSAGVPLERLMAVGGGSRNRFWVGLIATLLEMPIALPRGSANAAAVGAARLGSVACGDFRPDEALPRKPALRATIAPDAALGPALKRRHARFRALPM